MAIDEAISYNARKFKYIGNILKRWIDKGLNTIEKVRKYNLEKKSFITYCNSSVINNFNSLLKGDIKHFRGCRMKAS